MISDSVIPFRRHMHENCPKLRTEMETQTITIPKLFSWYITKAHSFPRTAEFRADPRNFGFSAAFEPRNSRGISSFRRGNTAEFDVFYSNNFFSQKMTSK